MPVYLGIGSDELHQYPVNNFTATKQWKTIDYAMWLKATRVQSCLYIGVTDATQGGTLEIKDWTANNAQSALLFNPDVLYKATTGARNGASIFKD